MDIRHPLYQVVASCMASLLILNPIAAAAAELAVDAAAGGNTTIGAAGNGVPVVNIATPNGAGLSHNKFSDYNVGQQGLILNNATDKMQSTQLGGMIIGNPNLQGQAAQKILNEVTGTNPSQLRGYTEVAGQSAHVIVSNQHGITCDGCGFINAPRGTLTTGKPILDAGRLLGYDVNGGEITIEGKGINATNLDSFELISRATKLNAELHANQLSVITGRNQVDAETLAATAKPDDGSAKPQLAIDSSALGGMYAGAIRLVGTEQGVGVRLAGNMAASAGDIQIDANGQLSLAQASSSANLRAKAQDIAVNGPVYADGALQLAANGQLSNANQVAAGQRVELSAAQLSNSGIIEAGVNPDNSRNAQGDVAIHAQAVRNSGSVVASRTLEVNASGTLENQRGASLRGTNTSVRTAALSNQGRILAGETLNLSGQQLGNIGGEVGAQYIQVSGGQLDNRLGLFSAGQLLSLNLAGVDNRQGTLSSRGSLTAQVGGVLDNSQGGRVVSDSAQQLRSGQVSNQAGGLVSSRGDLTIQTDGLDNRGGRIIGDATVNLTGDSLDNREGGRVIAGQHLQLTLDSLNNAGAIQSDTGLTLNARNVSNASGGQIAAKGNLTAQVEHFEQNGGELLSEGSLQVLAQQLINRQGGWIGALIGIDLRVGELFNQGAEISSQGAANLVVQRLDNSAGRIASDAGLHWQGDTLTNQAGSLIGQGGVTLQGGTLSNSQGRVSSQGNVDLTLSGTLDNHDRGQVISEGSLNVTAVSVDNRAGTLSSAQALNVSANALNNQGGKVLTDATLNVTAPTLDNRQGGVLSAKGVIDLRGATLLNAQAGRILGGADLLLAYARVDNSAKGRLEAAGQVAGKVRTLDQHNGGKLLSPGGIELDFAGGSLDNSGGGLIATPGPLRLLNLTQLNNSAGGEISSEQSFALGMNLAPSSLNNQGGRIVSSDELTVQLLGGTLDNSQAGVLYGKNHLWLDAASVNNSAGGTLASQGGIQVRASAGLDNHGDGAVAAGGGLLHIQVGSLNNQGGSLSSAQDFNLLSGNSNNQDGRITAQGLLDAQIGALDNRAGILSGKQQLTLGASDIDNRGGLVTTQGRLDLIAGKVDNRQGGEISSGGELKLRVDQLIQQQGRLITGGDLTLDLAGGDLDNRDAVLSVGGLLRIDNLRKLDNRGGEISSQHSFQLRAASIDNGDGGRLISAQQLTLDTGKLRNAGKGLISGWQSLVVNAADLDNSSGGTLSSKLGSLDVTLSGALDNHDEGALVSFGDQTLSAASLNNQGGILSGQQNLDLAIRDTLDNSAGGVISAQRQLSFKQTSTDLRNQNGQISAASLDLTANLLDNSGGSILSQGTLNLQLLGALLNNGAGSTIASGGPLTLRAASVENRAGQLASQSLLHIVAGRFDNSSAGTVAAQDDLTFVLADQLLNRYDGLIYSKVGQLSLSAASLDNTRGTLQGEGNLSLKTQGVLTNSGGRITSQAGNLDLDSSASLDNVGGILASLNGALKMVTQWFNNDSGIIQAQSLSIDARDRIHNRGGHLSATSGDNVIRTDVFDNLQGGLYAGRTLSVSGGLLNNYMGQIGATDIDFTLGGVLRNSLGLIESSGQLTLNTGSIENTDGRLRALGQSGATTLSTGLFINRNGRLESANTDLRLNLGGLINEDGTFLHVGTGQFGVSVEQILNAGGSFITTGRLDITADSWTNSSVLQAGWLNLNIGQFIQTASGQLLASQALTGRGYSWNNDGLLASDGSLDIQLGGNYSGNGRVTSLGDLYLSANQIDLGGSVAGGSNTTLGANTLNNYGRITAAGNLTTNTGVLNNYGTLGSAGQLRINTWDLLNDGQYAGALIFSGDDMTLRVGGSLTNRFADIYSLGGLDLAANDAGGRTARLDNLSANLESQRDMRLNVGALNNQRAVLVISQDGKYTARIVEVDCYKYLNDSIADCSGKRNGAWEVTERDRLRVTDSSAGSAISAGGNLAITGDHLNNASSTISAGQSLYAEVTRLTNTGVETGDTETFSVLKSERTRNMGSWIDEANAFTDLYWIDSPNYINDPAGLAAGLSHFIGRTEIELTQYRTVTQLDSGDQTYAAIIQAAGDVSINASERIDNSVIRNQVAYINPGQKTGDTAIGESPISSIVTLNAQLPPDLAQQQVNPISLPGFTLPSGSNGLFRLSGQDGTVGEATAVNGGESYSFSGQSIGLDQRERALSGATGGAEGIALENGTAAQSGTAAASLNVAQVQGVPSSARPDNSHKYLIETNPELTSLKAFLGSDYLLGLLGYDPDKAQKRLGDGLYEQRLVRDAVIARTGQRYIDGLTSDQDLFKYLMDNAIAYKEKVHLSLGVALTAEQVAALTHDIVWLEEATVNGEKVLVPVLYLAHADNRLGPNGALVMGNDVSLISGGDLSNQGTLRASGDLSATAANISNSGLIEAGGRLDLLALDSIRNTQGGIIAGRDVGLTALTGDVINQRSVTVHEGGIGDRTWTQGFADSAARIEAAGKLDISAGRDISNIGGAIHSGSDLSMVAGRDVNLATAELENGRTHGRNYDQSTTQLTGEISAGRDLEINAGRDINAIATRIDAGRDAAMSAGRDVTLASAADEEHSYSQTRKVTTQEDHVKQQSTELTAGGDVLISAGDNITLISSKIGAGNEAYLVAGDKVEVLAANDSDYSLYDKKDKGSWGSKQTRHDEVTDVKAVSSEISAGSDITILSGGDQRYQAAKLDSGGDIAIVSGGAVTFEAVKDYHQEAHNKEDSDLSWSSTKGKGSTDETLRQSQLTAEGEVIIKAVDGLHIDLKQIDQRNVSQTIDAMVQADPKLAWIKDAEARGDVDWRLVQEIHDSYSYSNSSLGAGPSLIIAIVAAAYLGPIYGAMASNLAIGTINNGGDIGRGLQHATNADALKGYAITAATAYVVNPYLNGKFEAHTDPTYNVTKGFNLDTWGMRGVGGFAAYSLAEGFAQSVMQQAAFGGSFVDNLGDAMGAQGSGLAMALGFNAVGNWAQGDYGGGRYAPGSPQKVIAHALMGGILAEATGSDFKTGAMAAGVNEAMANALSQWAKNDPKFELMASQVVGVLAAMAVDGDVSKGAEIAKNATAYNSQDHDHDGKIGFNDQLQEIKEQMGKRKSPLDSVLDGDGVPIAPNTTTTGGAFAAGMMGRIFGGGGKLTSVEFLPKATRYSAGQVEANISQSSAIKALESNGYNKFISQDGTVTVMSNGEKTYRFYPAATSTGQPSASLTVEGIKKPVVKIRFVEE